MRHISSFVDNQYNRNHGLYGPLRDAAEKGVHFEHDLDALKAYVELLSGSLVTTYKIATSTFAPTAQAPVILKYEDVFADCASALSPTHAAARLTYADKMNAYADQA
jgi:hypothetical protein